jgi:hypothetical protein
LKPPNFFIDQMTSEIDPFFGAVDLLVIPIDLLLSPPMVNLSEKQQGMSLSNSSGGICQVAAEMGRLLSLAPKTMSHLDVPS